MRIEFRVEAFTFGINPICRRLALLLRITGVHHILGISKTARFQERRSTRGNFSLNVSFLLTRSFRKIPLLVRHVANDIRKINYLMDYSIILLRPNLKISSFYSEASSHHRQVKDREVGKLDVARERQPKWRPMFTKCRSCHNLFSSLSEFRTSHYECQFRPQMYECTK